MYGVWLEYVGWMDTHGKMLGLRQDSRVHSVECLYPGEGQDNGNGGKKIVVGEEQPLGQAEEEALEGEELDRQGLVRRTL